MKQEAPMESLERPLSKGWRRSRTERSTSTPKKPAFDVYYWPPGEQRQKLRSIVDVSKYLAQHPTVDLSISDFTFSKTVQIPGTEDLVSSMAKGPLSTPSKWKNESGPSAATGLGKRKGEKRVRNDSEPEKNDSKKAKHSPTQHNTTVHIAESLAEELAPPAPLSPYPLMSALFGGQSNLAGELDEPERDVLSTEIVSEPVGKIDISQVIVVSDEDTPVIDQEVQPATLEGSCEVESSVTNDTLLNPQESLTDPSSILVCIEPVKSSELSVQEQPHILSGHTVETPIKDAMHETEGTMEKGDASLSEQECVQLPINQLISDVEDPATATEETPLQGQEIVPTHINDIIPEAECSVVINETPPLHEQQIIELPDFFYNNDDWGQPGPKKENMPIVRDTQSATVTQLLRRTSRELIFVVNRGNAQPAEAPTHASDLNTSSTAAADDLTWAELWDENSIFGGKQTTTESRVATEDPPCAN